MGICHQGNPTGNFEAPAHERSTRGQLQHPWLPERLQILSESKMASMHPDTKRIFVFNSGARNLFQPSTCHKELSFTDLHHKFVRNWLLWCRHHLHSQPWHAKQFAKQLNGQKKHENDPIRKLSIVKTTHEPTIQSQRHPQIPLRLASVKNQKPNKTPKIK